ncbi:hypothetical protein G6O67_006815 [Ophiocordyceps sinensis]|uniref:Uncharacterized protein n=1 Tax=Ophiocordyceps sinensis TaxID=72228 RepID=A0A8H4LXK1_9HYPO|nr:hypothetical protein G6O67_006815 [Ophiocordyceps sinensis]
MPAGRDVAKENVGQRAAGFLARQMGDEDRLDRGQVDPRLEQHGPDGVDDDDDVAVPSGGLLHQLVPAVPRIQSRGVAVAVVALDNVSVLAGVGGDEDNGDVVVAGAVEGRRKQIRVVEDDVARPGPDGRDGVVEIHVVDGGGAPALAEGALVAVAVPTSVGPVGVALGTGAEDAQGLLGGRQGQQTALVLEQRDGIAGDVSSDDMVVGLGGHELVDQADGRVGPGRGIQEALPLVRVGVKVCGREAARPVLAHAVPRGHDARRHVVEPVHGHGAVEHGARQLAHPVRGADKGDLRVARHVHVEAGQGRGHAGHVPEPVRHDEALQSELVLDEAVDEEGVLAARGAVDLQGDCQRIKNPAWRDAKSESDTHRVVSHHDGPDSGPDALGKGPHVEFVQDSIVYPIPASAAGRRTKRKHGLANVGAVSLLDRIVHAIDFLLVADKVLDGGDDAARLHAANRLARAHGLQHGVGAEALPVAAALWLAADGADGGPEPDVDALCAGLVANGLGAPSQELLVPGGAGGDGVGEDGDVVGLADAVGPVVEAELGEAETGDGARVAVAAAGGSTC